MVFVYQLASRSLCLLLLRAAVNMYLRAWTTRTCVTHLPEVIVLVTIDDMVFRQELFPDGSSLVVALQTLLG